jgi:hypothetical protein
VKTPFAEELQPSVTTFRDPDMSVRKMAYRSKSTSYAQTSDSPGGHHDRLSSTSLLVKRITNNPSRVKKTAKRTWEESLLEDHLRH